MATDEDYPIDLPILVIEAQIFVAVKKFPFLPNKLIPSIRITYIEGQIPALSFRWQGKKRFHGCGARERSCLRH